MKKSNRSPPCTRSEKIPREFCAGCYSNLRCRSNYRGHLGYRILRPVLSLMEMLRMKRDSSTPATKKGEWTCPDPYFKKTYPSLAQGLCDPFWDVGKPRIPWTLTIRFDAGTCNLCINDKDGGRGSYTTAETMAEALELVEAAIKAETLAWRRWKK